LSLPTQAKALLLQIFDVGQLLQLPLEFSISIHLGPEHFFPLRLEVFMVTDFRNGVNDLQPEKPKVNSVGS
jgi:hypothetical protein